MGLRVILLFGFVAFVHASWESLFGTSNTIPQTEPAAGTQFSGTAQVQVEFEQRVPVPADSVAVHCGDAEVTVEVKQNFLGNGQLIEPSDLTLGDCTAVNSSQHTLLYRAQLQDCDSTMTMTEETLSYIFRLLYSPTPIRDTAIVKTNPAEVVIECHYHRKQLVSSDVLKPTWGDYASHKLTQQELRFSLRLMTEDWRSERTSQAYVLNDLMHVEATVLQAHHVPLRVYVESCVAALDQSFTPSYSFINNHGCLMDAKLTGASSYFMPRTREDKLRFQIKTFRFPQDNRTTIYIICHLKATSVSVPYDAEHKACSFLPEANRWVASGGDNEVCTCCETSSCSEHRATRSVAEHTGSQWEGDVSLGPIVVQENLRFEEVMERRPSVVQEDAVMEETFSEASPQQAALLQTNAAPTHPGSQWEGDVSLGPIDFSLGPIVIQENLRFEEMERGPMLEETFSEASPQQATRLQTIAAPTLPVVLGGVGAALGVVALVFMGAVLHRRRAEPGGFAVCT